MSLALSSSSIRYRAARRPATLLVAAWVVAGVIVLAGCGGTRSVSRLALDHELSQLVGAAAHRAPPNISCPGDLPGKVGATEHCVLSVAGSSQRAGVLVWVTSVSRSHVHVGFQVARTPLPAGSG